MSSTVYLAHHGIKGQKWGIRRYQNPDGSLTAEGRKKYAHLRDDKGRLTINGSKMFKDKKAGDVVSEEEFVKALKKKEAKKTALGAAAIGSLIVAVGGMSVAGGVVYDDHATAKGRENNRANRERSQVHRNEKRALYEVTDQYAAGILNTLNSMGITPENNPKVFAELSKTREKQVNSDVAKWDKFNKEDDKKYDQQKRHQKDTGSKSTKAYNADYIKTASDQTRHQAELEKVAEKFSKEYKNSKRKKED